ncbi:sterol desaturase family protein [Flavobacteriaceae bacterium]|nr:sterol desaturase family protein [Flavobacteriaceae bacterium]
MIKNLLAIENFDVYFVIVIIIFFSLLETVSGFLKNSNRKKDDWIQEILSFVILGNLIKPSIVFFIFGLGNIFLPEYQFVLTDSSFIGVLLGYLLIDDLLQYWYHRTAHETPFLWKLHRPHHQAEEMGYLISYRNAFIYYLIMPNIWWVALILFLGGAKPVAFGLILKQLVIIGSHSRIKWDKPFYKNTLTLPIIKILERIIVTPTFHHSHHGTSKLEASSDPNGNFGNMFSIWDQLFGTATFHSTYPSAYGLQEKTNDSWKASYFYPLVKSKDEKSELSAGFKKPNTSSLSSITFPLTKGENYLWCACGKSKKQPFCDGSHHGTKFKPQKFTVKRSGDVKLCNCKKSKRTPFCDDTHLDLLN